MAISTYKVFLMRTTDNWASQEKLVDIKDFPDLGGTPEQLETTTLSDKMNTYIAGIQSLDALEFTANYTKSKYAMLHDLEEDENGNRIEHDLAIWFGGVGEGSTLVPTGNDGKFKFKGNISTYPVGGGVNAVIDMKITVTPTTVIEFDRNSSAQTMYTLSYDANGGSGLVSPQTASSGSVLSVKSGSGLTAPSGKTFRGWATSSSGTASYGAGDSYTLNSSAILYAVWES